MTWIPRTVARILPELARTFPVLVVTGARQTGKTALVERTFADYRYVSLDLPQLAEFAETRPTAFLETYRPPLVIDEVQYAPGLFRHIKAAVDADRSARGQFVLTGSQSFPLMENLSDSLAGRAAVLPLLGLSFSEWRNSPAMDPRNGAEFLWHGSFPGLWSEPGDPPDRTRWYQGYVSTYLERDIRSLLNVGSLRDFERFLRVCALRTGQVLNMSDMGRDVGVSPTTARQWLSVLQASGQVFLLEPYYRSLGKRIAKRPKLYFPDTGLAAYLSGFSDARSMLTAPMMGALWENHVVSQWLRWKEWQEPAASLWFWQDQTKNEVDLVVEVNQAIHLIECKWKERSNTRDTKGINACTRMYGELVASASIACVTPVPYDTEEGVTVRPGWDVWELS